MPGIRAIQDDGTYWILTNCEVVIPIRHVEHLTAKEIGERVFAYKPFVQQILATQHHRDFPDGGTLEDLQRFLQRQDIALQQLQAERTRIKDVRQEMQRNYHMLFVALGRRDGFLCRYCHCTTTDLEIDHVFPVIKGGTNELSNLQLLCQPCNRKKGSV